VKTLIYGKDGFFEELKAFNDAVSVDPAVSERVATILADIRDRGDEAIRAYTETFDGFDAGPEGFRVDPAEFRRAEASLTAQQRIAIEEARDCVRGFHEKGLPTDWTSRNPHGALVGERWYPVERVGIYIPAGNVPLVSTVVMTATLAQLAGVEEIAVATPAGKSGRISDAMLSGLSVCGIEEVYRIGGAQAIGAFAYGTESIPEVCKIMGPGNAYVAEAQRQVFGKVGIDLLPGPSEALAYADETAKPNWLAADLIAQAEHGSGKEKIYFVYHNRQQAEQVGKAVLAQIPERRHAAAISKVWEESTLFIEVPDQLAAVKVMNFVAPEHLELHVEPTKIDGLLKEIRTAGAILCGHETPTVLGDFTAGPSHTLPTGRTGRFFSGLKITDFMRRSSVVQYDRESLERAKGVIEVFSHLEDLDGHGRSMTIRDEP